MFRSSGAHDSIISSTESVSGGAGHRRHTPKGLRPAPPEVVEAMAAYNTGDYEGAVAKQLVVVEKRTNDVLTLFNAACFEARLGRTDDAIEHLQRAIEADGRIKENIHTDEDLDPLREDPRFAELVK
jgi:tetratricopeptide (TPR) repeat protein